METLLLSPNLLTNEKNVSLLSNNLEEEVMSFKPFIIKDVLLLSPGRWNEKYFSKESIVNGFYKTDWSNKENYALIYSHDERAENWVGNVINRKVTEEGKLYGDLEIYDKNLAIKLGKGKAKLGISAKIGGDINGENFMIDSFRNFSVVYDPACKEAFINLSESGIITSDTSQGSQVQSSNVNRKIDYDDEDEKKKKTEKKDDELSNSIEGKKGEDREMEEKVKEVKAEESAMTEELNSKITQILDKLVSLSDRVEKLESSEEVAEEVSEEAEEPKEEVKEESEEEVVEEVKEEVEEPAEELSEEKEEVAEEVEESKEEVSEEKPSVEEELSKRLAEAEKKIAELSALDKEPASKTTFELSREDLGPGQRNISDFEMNLLKTLNKFLR